MLLAWATLHSLEKVRRNVTVRPEMVTMVWNNPGTGKPWMLNLLFFTTPEPFLALLVSTMTTLGVGVEKTSKTQSKINESDVTKEAIQQMDIEQILEHIEDYEEEVQDNDLSLSSIQTLITLYQKAIEYYSALDNLQGTAEFLQRMQNLYQREEVQIVLNSLEEESK